MTAPRHPSLRSLRGCLLAGVCACSLSFAAWADPQAEFAVLEQQGMQALERLDFGAAEALRVRMRALADAHAHPAWLSRVRFQEGMQARRQGRSEDALRLFGEALEVARRHGDRLAEVDSLNAYSTMQRRAGNLYQALDGHTRALELARVLGQPQLVADSLAKIGRIYAELDDLEPALDFYRQAITAADPADTRQLTELESDVANVCIRLGRIDEARAAVARTRALAEASGAPDLIAVALGREARLLLLEDRPAQALPLIDRAIELARPFDGARSVLVRQALRLEVLSALGRWEEAAQAIGALINGARRTGDLLTERKLLDLQGEILMGIGDARGAYAAAREYHRIQQGMATTMTSRRIADLEASMHRRQMEADVQLLQRQGELQRLTVERQRLIGLVMSSALVCILLGVVALVWRYRAMRRLHQALQHSSQALQLAARTDPLTGLGNRQAIPDAGAFARQAFERREQCGVILIDLDHFKRINDEHGHLVGDQVLQAVASALRLALPAEMQLVRWGGEEFLACGIFRDRDHALAVAETLRRAVRNHPARENGQALAGAPSISLGVCVAEGPVASWEPLIRQADHALYSAKDAGRNRVCLAGAA
ncbi:MAG: diguanylate cyclase [Rhodanobacteraceae bacterium]|nr:diguanylate cyclase [Rhodanobacteraceae bacterium]